MLSPITISFAGAFAFILEHIFIGEPNKSLSGEVIDLATSTYHNLHLFYS
jgi:hypothetical protein